MTGVYRFTGLKKFPSGASVPSHNSLAGLDLACSAETF